MNYNLDGMYVDFDGEALNFGGDVETMSDDDFDYIFRSKAKKDCISRQKELGKSGSEARKICRIEKRGDDVASDVNAPTDKKGCMQFYMDQGVSKRTARNKCKLATKFGTQTGGVTGGVSGTEMGYEETEITADGMPKQAGVLGNLKGNKALLIVGGVLAVGILALALRPRR